MEPYENNALLFETALRADRARRSTHKHRARRRRASDWSYYLEQAGKARSSSHPLCSFRFQSSP